MTPLKLKLKFLDGRGRDPISKVSPRALNKNGNRNWVIFPARGCSVTPGNIYEAEVVPHPRREGIAFAKIRREVPESDPSLWEPTHIDEKGRVTLCSKFYPTEEQRENANVRFSLNEEGVVTAEFTYGPLKRKVVVFPDTPLYRRVSPELLREAEEHRRKKREEQEERKRRVKALLSRLEAEIVKTPLEIREVFLRPEEVAVEHLYDDEEWGQYRPTYSYIGTKVASKRGIDYTSAWRSISEDPTLGEALEDEYYKLLEDPEREPVAHKEYYRLKEEFNKIFVKEVQCLSSEALDMLRENFEQCGVPKRAEDYASVRFEKFVRR
jgi:hypothetical protein